MKIKRIKFQNYTAFEDQQMEFSPGINVIIGENGTGKTHLMKALYSACQSADKKTSFSHKLVMTMLPDDYKISRLYGVCTLIISSPFVIVCCKSI